MSLATSSSSTQPSSAPLRGPLCIRLLVLGFTSIPWLQVIETSQRLPGFSSSPDMCLSLPQTNTQNRGQTPQAPTSFLRKAPRACLSPRHCGARHLSLRLYLLPGKLQQPPNWFRPRCESCPCLPVQHTSMPSRLLYALSPLTVVLLHCLHQHDFPGLENAGPGR